MEIVFLLAIGVPFLLWIGEKFFPYPYILEEVFKFFLVWQIFQKEKERLLRIKAGFIVGILFSLSEAFFYLIEALQKGHLIFFSQRVALTSLLHITTILLIIFWGELKRELFFLGLILAIGIHWGYNTLIPLLLPH